LFKQLPVVTDQLARTYERGANIASTFQVFLFNFAI